MRRHLWWILGLVLVVGGVVLGLANQPGPADFGWFAYTPLSEDPDWTMGWGDSPLDGSVVIVSWWQLAGAALAAIGLLVVAAAVGFRLGRRRT
ncbi:hypothetical protein [Nocardioides sp. AX2bis]|uniref:hypothetical protein n=1 Tax=Nocardioides sp. AX2bis TaxID=2653157 RepID=UPI0012EFC72B|nr:hypothetical protein [Nocardioides sp. AX2bis]VXB43764.1 conserved hypothetical protein [Nocardioides sp. AX2bis]